MCVCVCAHMRTCVCVYICARAFVYIYVLYMLNSKKWWNSIVSVSVYLKFWDIKEWHITNRCFAYSQNPFLVFDHYLKSNTLYKVTTFLMVIISLVSKTSAWNFYVCCFYSDVSKVYLKLRLLNSVQNSDCSIYFYENSEYVGICQNQTPPPHHTGWTVIN
jgi:hypothetical protein